MTQSFITPADMSSLRDATESRMLTTCEIQYMTGRTTQDPVNGAEVPVYATAFESKCRVKSPGLAVHRSEGGGRTTSEVTRQLHLPVSSQDPWADPASAAGVFALITELDPAMSDPSLLGARLTLSGAAPGDQTTARRLEVTEVVQ